MKDLQFLTELGARIKKIRVEKNITQYQLAINCEFEKASMSRIESGQINITILTLLRISIALDVSMADLVERSTNHTTNIVNVKIGIDGELLKSEKLNGHLDENVKKNGMPKDHVDGVGSKADILKNNGKDGLSKSFRKKGNGKS